MPSTALEYVAEFLVLEHCIVDVTKKIIHSEIFQYFGEWLSDVDMDFTNRSIDIKTSWIHKIESDWTHKDPKHPILSAIHLFTEEHSEICASLFDTELCREMKNI